MAVVVQSFEFALAGGLAATNVTVNKPTGVAVGDLLILLVGNEDNTATASFAAKTGWTKQYEFGDATPDTKIGCYTRIADGTEGASETIDWNATGADAGGAWYLRVTGHDPTVYWDTLGTSSQTAGATSQAAASITPTLAGCLVFAHHSFDGGDGTRSVSGTNWPSSFPTNQVLYDTIGTTAWSGGWVTQLQTSAVPSNNCTFASNVSDGMVQVQFAIAPIQEGIATVSPTEFDYDEPSIDVAGLNFLATQTTATVYISDAATLAGSVNEVDITSAVNTWSDSNINLDLTLLSAGELASLQTLGPGARFIIVLTSTPDEYSKAVTTHRPQAFEMALGAATPGTTTARLTGLTGTFGGGRIEETAAQNPSTTTTDVAANGNREDVWSIQGKTLSREVQYDFRVLYGGIEATSYTVTPKVTIGGGASGAASIPAVTASGVAKVIRKASGAVALAAVVAAGSAYIWPKVYLNTTQTLAGATEMTVTAANEAGTSITFTDPAGAPTGSLFLGVENRNDSNVAWIAVTVNVEGLKIASGAAAITPVASSGVAKIIKPASGSASIASIVSAGAATIRKLSSGAVTTPAITAAGVAETINTASGAPSLAIPTASGAATLIRHATGAVTTPTIVSAGTASVQGVTSATGTPSTPMPSASGTGTVGRIASGAATTPAITSAGSAKIIKIADGSANFALQSEAYDTSDWLPSFETVVNPNVTTDARGDTKADRIIDWAGGGFGTAYVEQVNIPCEIGQVPYIVWTDFKADQVDWGFIQVVDLGPPLQINAYFDLTNGTIGTVGADNTREFMIDKGNGWWRCGIEFNSDVSDPSLGLRLYAAEAGSAFIPLDGTTSVFVGGTQVKRGNRVTPYIETFAVPVGGAVLPPISASGIGTVGRIASGAPTVGTPTASGAAIVGRLASGAPTLPLVTTQGVAGITGQITSSGAPSVTIPTAAGVARVDRFASGAPTLPIPTASGTAEVIKTASGAPSIPLITAQGIAEVINSAAGAPSLAIPTASGVATVGRLASGTPVLPLITAQGVAQVVGITTASGTPTLVIPVAAGTSTVGRLASGAPTLPLITSAGSASTNGAIISSGAATITPIVASGAAKITRHASGAASITSITASGAAKIIKIADGSPNLVLQSLDYSRVKPFWDLDFTNPEAIVDSNVTLDSRGELKADRMRDLNIGGNGAVRLEQFNIPIAIGGHTFVAYAEAKADTLDWLHLQIADLGSQFIGAYFDLTNGVVGTQFLGTDNISEFCIDLGNGWWRCGILFTSETPPGFQDPAMSFRHFASPGDGLLIVPLDGNQSIFLGGSQVKRGDRPTNFVETFAEYVYGGLTPPITASGTGTVRRIASGAPSTPMPSASGTGTVGRIASGAVTVPLLTTSGEATLTRHASGAPSTPLITAQGTIVGSIGSDGAVLVPVITTSGAAKIRKIAVGSVSTPPLVPAGTAAVPVRAVGAPSIPSLISNSSAKLIHRATNGTPLAIYDDFNRPGPNIGPDWKTIFWNDDPNPLESWLFRPIIVGGNRVQQPAVPNPPYGLEYQYAGAWHNTKLPEDHFAECTVTNWDTDNYLNSLYLYIRGNSDDNNNSCYYLGAAGSVTASDFSVSIHKWNPGPPATFPAIRAAVQLNTVGQVADGTRFRISAVGNVISTYWDRGNGWEFISSVVDNSFTGVSVGFELEARDPNGMAVDDFGAGTFGPIVPSFRARGGNYPTVYPIAARSIVPREFKLSTIQEDYRVSLVGPRNPDGSDLPPTG